MAVTEELDHFIVAFVAGRGFNDVAMRVKTVTLRDVARRVGLSMGATSRALIHNPNCTARVSEATRQRVRSVAAEMGYRHNRAAQSLRTGRTGILAIIMPNALDFMSARRMRAAVVAAWDGGLSPMVFYYDRAKLEDSEQLFSSVLDSGADAVLLCGRELTARHIAPLVERGLPVVSAGFGGPLGVACYFPDKRDGFFQLGRHLLAEGYRSIGLLSVSLKGAGPGDLLHTRAAVGGFEDVMKWARDEGIELDSRVFALKNKFVDAGMDAAGSLHPLYSYGYFAMRELIGKGPLPAAIMCQNDAWAAAAARACGEEGIRVPQDVAITGFENDPSSSVGSVPLTTVDHPVEEIFRRAVKELLRLLQSGERSDAAQCPVPCQLIVRQSSTCRPVGRPERVEQDSLFED